MILSVSRRTDVPNYYSDWFYNRIKEGFLYVRNPMNGHQVSRIDLSPEVVDCIVFWTKNPFPMMARLGELKAYDYYFQFSLTGYGKDIEPNLPDKRSVLIPVFKHLSEELGRGRVVWRYDPVLLNGRYTMEYHKKAFAEIAGALNGYCEQAVISFIDIYAKIAKRMEGMHIREPNMDEMYELAAWMAEVSRKNGMEISTCAEKTDLDSIGIGHGSCIDKRLIERLTGCGLDVGRDKNQRAECGCVQSIDAGTYNTCQNGCRYCYANFSDGILRENVGRYDAASPVLCGSVGGEDKITDREVKSLKVRQLSLFDAGREWNR